MTPCMFVLHKWARVVWLHAYPADSLYIAPINIVMSHLSHVHGVWVTQRWGFKLQTIKLQTTKLPTRSLGEVLESIPLFNPSHPSQGTCNFPSNFNFNYLKHDSYTSKNILETCLGCSSLVSCPCSLRLHFSSGHKKGLRTRLAAANPTWKKTRQAYRIISNNWYKRNNFNFSCTITSGYEITEYSEKRGVRIEYLV